jgi:pimeloyl-ACP methyl ester carboxylesterase
MAVHEPLTTASVRFVTGSITAKDGTVVHYRQLGRGPGLVILHGAMESAASHMMLAEALSDAFTVYLPERRGHNLPGPFRKDYSIQQEVDDLDALLTEKGIEYVFGVSAGGLIALQAGLTLPALRKVAVYEPALVVNHSISMAFLPRYEREIAEGNIVGALVSGMLGGRMGAPIFNYMPRWLLEYFTRMGLKSEDKTARPGDVTMRTLAPTLYYDFHLANEMAESVGRFKAMRPDVLLLGGDQSPAWLKQALDALEKTIPHVQRVEFPGLNHGGSSDPSATNRASKPAVVAEAMRRFFG